MKNKPDNKNTSQAITAFVMHYSVRKQIVP